MDRKTQDRIRRFKDHLNQTCPGAGLDTKCGSRTGSRTRSYGDYLYAQDRDMFLWEMNEAIAKGEFK